MDHYLGLAALLPRSRDESLGSRLIDAELPSQADQGTPLGRRAALLGMGAAGAAAWAVPSIVSIQAASAQSGAGLMATYIQANNGITEDVASGVDLAWFVLQVSNGITLTPGTNFFSVTVAGTYLVSTTIRISSGIGSMFRPTVNGVVTGVGITFTELDTVSTDNLIDLAAGDVVTIRNSSGTPATVEEAVAIIIQIA